MKFEGGQCLGRMQPEEPLGAMQRPSSAPQQHFCGEHRSSPKLRVSCPPVLRELRIWVFAPSSRGESEEVPEHSTSILCQNTLGVELNALHGELLVPHAHNNVLAAAILQFSPRGDFHALGDGRECSGERVVPSDRERSWQSLVDTLGVMLQD